MRVAVLRPSHRDHQKCSIYVVNTTTWGLKEMATGTLGYSAERDFFQKGLEALEGQYDIGIIVINTNLDAYHTQSTVPLAKDFSAVKFVYNDVRVSEEDTIKNLVRRTCK